LGEKLFQQFCKNPLHWNSCEDFFRVAPERFGADEKHLALLRGRHKYRNRFWVEQRAAKLRSPDIHLRASARWPKLSDWQGLFLEQWRVKRERMEAAIAVGKSWRDVEKSLGEDRRFADAYEELEQELLVMLEDSHLNQAIAGKSHGAQKLVLERRSAMYAKNGAQPAGSRPASPARAARAHAEDTWGRIFNDAERSATDDAAPSGAHEAPEPGAILGAAVGA
jgi:hypothetical protein